MADVAYSTIVDWRGASSKDGYSIFRDPHYADVLGRDFRLLPDRPSMGAGEGGSALGALGTMQPGR